MDRKDVLDYLKKNYDNLTESQKEIGKYVLDNYKEVAFLSAAELGERVGVSDATIIRFARSIGFNGFADFKNSIRESMKSDDSPEVRLLKSWPNIKDNWIGKIGKADLKNAEQFLMNLDTSKLNEAVDHIHKANMIYLVGLGSSKIVTEFLAWHLRRMGFRVETISEGGIILFDKLAPITKHDLLILCTFPRYSKDTLNSILLAKKRGASVLTITDSSFSKISVNSDIVFAVPSENLSFFNSYIVPIMLCNILLIAVFERDRNRIFKNLKDNMKVIAEFDLYI